MTNQPQITLSHDKLTAFIGITEPIEQITTSQISDLLAKNAITYGIDDSLISDLDNLKNKLNLERKVIIASSEISVRNIISFAFNIDRKPGTPLIDSKGRAHYKELQYLDNIKAGGLLATLIQPLNNILGKNVLGEDLTVESFLSEFKVGQNVELSEDGRRYYSTVDGMPVFIDNTLSVQEKVVIDRNVDIAVGNLDFVGSIEINGNVEYGFDVKTGGKLIIRGDICNGGAEVGGDLGVKHGIITGQKHCIVCDNSIHAKFIENSKVDAGKDIYVDQWLMHDRIEANGLVVVGNGSGDGYIIGGNCHSRLGVVLDEAGTRFNVPTIISVDYSHKYYEGDPLYDKYLETNYMISNQNDVIKKSYQNIENAKNSEQLNFSQKAELVELFGEKIYDAREILAQLEVEQDSLINELKSKKYLIEPIVLVRKTIWPGVIIKINGTKLRIRNKIEHVVFRYNEGSIDISDIEEVKDEFYWFC